MQTCLAATVANQIAKSMEAPKQDTVHSAVAIATTGTKEATGEATGVVSTWRATNNLRKAFRAVGFSMSQKNRYVYLAYTLFINSFTIAFFPVGFVLGYCRLVRSDSAQLDIGLLLTSMQAFTNVLACYGKSLALTLTQRQWSSADEIMARLDRRCGRSPQEMQAQRQCVRHGNRCMIFFAFAYWTYTTSTFLSAFVLERPLYDLYIPFLNWRHSRPQFVISALMEYMIVNMVCLQQAFDDAFAVIFVHILRTHMKILLLRFANLGNNANSLTENLAELKRCIRDHQNYLELYDTIAPIISKSIFIQFAATALVLSTTLVNILLIANDFTSRIGSFFYIIAVILEILPVCYYAQCLKDDSSRLSEVIFHSNWIDQDVRYRKMLVFLMHRTQCNKDLTAGKLFPINLSCCLSIVKFSFTLYTFIKTMGLQEKFGM